MKYFILFTSVSMTVLANVLLKIGSRAINFESGLFGVLTGYASSPAVVAGFVSYALAAILWVYCLGEFDLSYAAFVASFQYVLLLAASILVFHEHISLMKWAGCFFIMMGVFFWVRG